MIKQIFKQKGKGKLPFLKQFSEKKGSSMSTLIKKGPKQKTYFSKDTKSSYGKNTSSIYRS